MKVAIAIPIYLSSDILFDFTKETLETIKSQKNELSIYIINNFSKPELHPSQEKFNLDESIKKFKVIDSKENSVSKAWNLGIKTALEDGNDYVIVANNDLVFHPEAIDNLVDFAEEHPEFILWTDSEYLDKKTLKNAVLTKQFSVYPHFSCFMVNQKTIDIVGWFDENLKMAYHEDGEYHYRILLSGNKAGKTESAKFYHYGSRTIKVDEKLYDINKRTYEDNRDYIGNKWNIDFHDKVFVPPEKMLKVGYPYPFNDEGKGWRDW